MATKKKTTKKSAAPAKKSAPKSSAKPKKKIPMAEPVFEEKAPKPKKEHTFLKSATPYILIILGVIIGISFFTVQLLGLDDGAGVLGYAIQYFFCGLFGISAFLIPAVLIYVGIKWCIYNVKKKETFGVTSDEAKAEELAVLRRRNVLQTVMASLLVLFVAAMIGIFADAFDSFELADMWSAGAEDLEGGGLLGGALGVLFVMAFAKVISIILIIILIALCVILIIGLTPDRIVLRIRESRRIAREEREALEAELAEEERLAAEEELAEQRKREARAKATRREEFGDEEDRPRSRVRAVPMSVDEMVDTETGEVYIGPSEEMQAKAQTQTQPQTQKGNVDVDALMADVQDDDEPEDTGVDFGGDPVFDNPEFQGISGVIANLKSEPKKPPVEQVYDEADDDDQDDEDIALELIGVDELQSDMAAVAPDDAEEIVEPEEVELPYVFPPMDMLEKNKNTQQQDFTAELQENAKILMETLKSFKVNVREITYSRGPTITRYELKPEAGTRVRAIANLVDDIALNLATSGVRIEAPIPNKPAVGIEVPNRERATVYLRDLIESSKFTDAKSRLTSSLGMDVGGNPIYFDIAKMPHLLIAGATGMGKSVCINSIIVSILYKAKPSEVKLILVDPKKVEFNIYKDIPHLYAPIVSDPKKAAGALASAVAEMERRFELIEEVGVRDIATYNAVTENDPTKEFMPQMVIIIDELADLMMTAPDEVEASICRLAQKARAAGIHIIIGTQRPSVDVITGLIKANIPSRIACTVASQIDSRTILDMAGAEKLIGRGDMLFAPVGASKPMRVQGAFVSEAEVERIVTFIKENNTKAKYNSDFISRIEEEAAKCGAKKGAAGGGGMDMGDESAEGGDSKFADAVQVAISEGKISTSLLQRRLGVGYGRAAKLIDTMEEMGYVSKPDGNKPRKVLITMDQYLSMNSED